MNFDISTEISDTLNNVFRSTLSFSFKHSKLVGTSGEFSGYVVLFVVPIVIKTGHLQITCHELHPLRQAARQILMKLGIPPFSYVNISNRDFYCNSFLWPSFLNHLKISGNHVNHLLLSLGISAFRHVRIVKPAAVSVRELSSLNSLTLTDLSLTILWHISNQLPSDSITLSLQWTRSVFSVA